MNYCICIAALGLSAGLGIAAEPGSLSATGRAMHAPVDLPDHRVGVSFWPQKESSSAVIVPRSLPPSVYPVELLSTAVNGFAKLEFVIGHDGVVRDVRAEADSDAAFVPASVAAVQNWTFQPVVDRKTSLPVTARMSCQFAFLSYRDDDGVPGLMGPFAHTRLTGREVVELAEQEVRKQGIDLSKYPGAFAPNPNVLYPNISVYQARDGRVKWFVKWSKGIDDTRWENLSVWLDDRSRVAHVNDAPGEWKELPASNNAVTVLFRLERGSSVAVVPASLPSPAYPFDLAWAGIGGSVEVSFVIKPEGGVADTKLVRSSQREFEAPVAEVIKQWRFRSTAGQGPNDADVKVAGIVVFQIHPDDRYDFAPHGPAFVLARLSGHEVARLAVAKANEQGGEIPLLREPAIHIYGTRQGHSATPDGSVRWLFDDFLPNAQLWIDDASGKIRVEPKSSYTFVLLRDVPEEILAIAKSTAVANVGALDEFDVRETRFDTVKSRWVLSFRRRGKVIPWGPDFSVFVDAKTHAARFQTGGINGR
jgi:TonB family protein